MAGEDYPVVDDTGTAARQRRDEVEGLIEIGVSTDTLQAQPTEAEQQSMAEMKARGES
jgi:hypothetical protein